MLDKITKEPLVRSIEIFDFSCNNYRSIYHTTCILVTTVVLNIYLTQMKTFFLLYHTGEHCLYIACFYIYVLYVRIYYIKCEE